MVVFQVESLWFGFPSGARYHHGAQSSQNMPMATDDHFQSCCLRQRCPAVFHNGLYNNKHAEGEKYSSFFHSVLGLGEIFNNMKLLSSQHLNDPNLSTFCCALLCDEV